MQAVVALACLRMGLTAAEAISAATINGAHALGCADRVGRLSPANRRICCSSTFPIIASSPASSASTWFV